MRKLWIVAVVCVLFGTFSVRPMLAGSVVVGMNTPGISQLSEAQQDELITRLKRYGVTVVRTSLGPGFQHFITRAYQNGISCVVILNVMSGSTGAFRPAEPSLGLTWGQQALSDASPEEFRKWPG